MLVRIFFKKNQHLSFFISSKDQCVLAIDLNRISLSLLIELLFFLISKLAISYAKLLWSSTKIGIPFISASIDALDDRVTQPEAFSKSSSIFLFSLIKQFEFISIRIFLIDFCVSEVATGAHG